ncbi:hypothetical protein NMK71_11390 [Weeksellaceae bacterium KMM 9713]|uniref:Uncharacterized protein n=1 Tax=Profundicola chukchiensis TaxID=2961959 RepID=A0A9X4N158_9FLAO|nr:hypothetical protein [Profundicola chukchiensis]MDG4947015.1 hypothetical protein [Profundicola chukchiensis]
MKTIINIIIASLTLGAMSAQVAIEKDVMSSSSVILEFNDTRVGNSNGVNKALILPVVSTINSNSVAGTIWFDAAANKIQHFKMNGVDKQVVDMSAAGSDESTPSFDEEANISNGTIIGEETPNTPPGVLVLEANDKAMVLPVVDGVRAVINPEPGSMVYDRSTKSVAVFNGEVWSFWGK